MKGNEELLQCNGFYERNIYYRIDDMLTSYGMRSKSVEFFYKLRASIRFERYSNMPN